MDEFLKITKDTKNLQHISVINTGSNGKSSDNFRGSNYF